MSARIRTAAAAALALVLAAAIAQAGVVLQMEMKDAKDPAPTQATLWMAPDRLRMDTPEASIIFRDDKQVLWVMEAGKKSYLEMTAADAEKLGGMMAQMQAQLAQMPPEQRAMVQQMMASRMGGAAAMGGAPAAAPAPLAYAKTGKSETINGWSCTSYDATRSGKREEELWVTGFTDFGLTPEDFAVCQKMAEFMKKIGGPMAERIGEQPFAKKIGTDPDALPGVPIRTIGYHQGGTFTHEIKKVSKEDVAASKFEVPAGYAKESMGDKMGGGD